MAKLAHYEVPPPQLPGAQEELEQLVETLHRSGTLRVLNGLFGQLGKVSDVAMDSLNSPKGRNTVGVILAAGAVAGEIDASGSARSAQGATRGLQQAQAAAKPPGIFKLVRLLLSADTRRAIGAVLLVLNRVGASMRKPELD